MRSSFSRLGQDETQKRQMNIFPTQLFGIPGLCRHAILCPGIDGFYCGPSESITLMSFTAMESTLQAISEHCVASGWESRSS